MPIKIQEIRDLKRLNWNKKAIRKKRGQILACPIIPLKRTDFLEWISILRDPNTCPIGDIRFPAEESIPTWNGEELRLRAKGTI